MSERNLIAVYSANIQSIKADVSSKKKRKRTAVGAHRQTVDPCTSSEEFLSGKIRWTIYESSDDYQLRYALDMITAYVNKRDRGMFTLSSTPSYVHALMREELKASLEGILNAIWIKEVIDTEQPFDIRRKALLVYLHVSILVTTC